MTALTVTAEDIAALDRDGDLIAYIRSLTAAAPTPTTPTTPAAMYGASHRPGAWPAGTRPAGPNTCAPDCTCSLAPHQPDTTALPPAA